MTDRTMLRLAKAFWEIALWRRTPAQLPAIALEQQLLPDT
jgi:hypothetical protein